MATVEPRSIAILGAGATGLTAAYRLTRMGHRVRVFEASNRVGGAVRTERSGGWLIEAGPNSLLSGEPAVARLIAELDLTGAQIPVNSAARNRYIVRDRQLVPAPLSPPAFLKTSLFSPAAKLRVLGELLARPRVRTTDVSVAEFLRSHFGTEIVDYAVDPFVSGIYAGDPARLSARHAFPKIWALEKTHGSLLRGQMKTARERKAQGVAAPQIFSFAAGLQMLTDALATGVPRDAITLNACIDAILPGEKWSVVWHDTRSTHTQSFDALVVALPGHALSELRIGALGERPLAALSAVEHPPVSSLFLGYRRDQVKHALDGFGVLIPSREQRSALGVLFSSSLFEGRAPEGHVALTAMVGGTRRPDLASLPTDRLLAALRRDLSELLGVSGEPVFVRHTFWPRAIPQYNLGHEQFLSAIAAAEAAHRRLFIGGQVRDGISLPACIAAGEKLAQRAAT